MTLLSNIEKDNILHPTVTIYCRNCGALLQNLSDIKQEDKFPCQNCGSQERFYVRVGVAGKNGEAITHTKKIIERNA